MQAADAHVLSHERRSTSDLHLPFDHSMGDVRNHVNFLRRAMILEIVTRLSLRVPGNIIEFGVASGASTRAIRRTLHRYGRSWFVPHRAKKLFALDSFEGLSSSFDRADAGAFAGEVPRIRGVEFVKGYFEETCTPALAARVGRVAFAHLDADLYGSTLTALTWLTPLLGSGSLILFDEFLGGEHDEQRAFNVWSARCGLTLVRIAEFDRDPSGFGSRPDRRLLFQVVGTPIEPRDPRHSPAWRMHYYLGRLGLMGLQERFAERY